ncbi:protein phosphatase Slingshot homolog 1-like isoform X1 [Oscarella lobularis]|uniref:protein phosphatase Slingshot homolog 1-like isoform X1 n=1 Tax=Oscarella lobularis TaxID=121494 RepID=UPI003313D98F
MTLQSVVLERTSFRAYVSLRQAVELEWRQPFGRYIVIVASMGLQDTEENLLLGVDWIDKRLRVAFVFPIWRDTTVVLNGDGGFSISSGARRHIFKRPVSVQCMWAAFQALHKACELARAYNYYLDGLSHTSSAYYKTLLTGEWNWHEDVETRPDSPPLFFLAVGAEQSEKDLVKQLLSSKLKRIMMTVDLETVTSRQLRQSLQEDLQMVCASLSRISIRK